MLPRLFLIGWVTSMLLEQLHDYTSTDTRFSAVQCSILAYLGLTADSEHSFHRPSAKDLFRLLSVS